MKKTVFTTPILATILNLIARCIVKLIGWHFIGSLPEKRRFVLIGAPHTSNWDFILMLLAMLILRLEVHWMGKDSLFAFPFGGFMKWLGGIPIDRSSNHNTVDQIIMQFEQHDELIVLVPPEGTRSKVEKWKTGFYHIANGADVPILLGFIDAGKKEMGFGPMYQPTGDIEKDLPEIQAFYKTKQAIHPELQ